jgi:pilus assembly protein CpaC
MMARVSHMVTALLLGLGVTGATTSVQATDLPAPHGASVMNASDRSLMIEVNKGTLIRLDRPATEVFIANPEVADVQVKSNRVVYIFGKAQGETTFYALDENDNTIFGANVQVTRNLGALRSAYDRMLPGVPIEVTTVGQLIVLQGNVGGPDEAALAERLAHTVLGTDQVMNSINILQPTQVNLRVRIAEVSRTVLKQLGVSWEGFASSGSSVFGLLQTRNVADLVMSEATGLPFLEFQAVQDASSIVGKIGGGGLDINWAIDAMDREGFLRVLAEPNLTALTGQTANFLAGGEFPIPVPSRDGIGIEYREFGVQLDFTPTVLNTGRISMHVKPEVSDLSTAGAIRVEGISVPSISTRRAETTIELGSGQSFAIAGLLQNNIVQDADKFPGLGDIPIIGALFKSEKFRREETELLIVVTPYIVRPISDHKIVLPTDKFIAPGDMDRFMNGRRWVPTDAQAATPLDTAEGAALKKRAGFQLD